MQKTGSIVLWRTLLLLCDAVVLALLLALPLLWIFAPLRLQLGARHVTLTWHIWWYLLPVLLLAVRRMLQKAAVGRSAEVSALYEQGWFLKVAFPESVIRHTNEGRGYAQQIGLYPD